MTALKQNDVIISIYDFDNTVYKGNSTVDFWKYALIRYPYLILWIPYQSIAALLWRCSIMHTGRFKEAFLSFIRAIPPSSLESCINGFWNINMKKIPGWVWEHLEQDKNNNLLPICISASPDFLLKKTVKKLGFEVLLCSEFKKRRSVQTNKLKVPNCKGYEKVRRLKEWASREDIQFVVQKVYADDITDLPLYQTAKEHYYVRRGILREGIPTA